MRTIIALAILVGWCAVAIFGDYTLKASRLLFGTALYASCALPSYYMFHRYQFGWVTVAWAAISVPVGLAAAVLFCGESISVRRALAAMFAIIAVALLGE